MINILATIRQTVFHGQLGGMELAAHEVFRSLVTKGATVRVISSALTDESGHEEARELDGVFYHFAAHTKPGKYSNELHRASHDFLLSYKDRFGAYPDAVHSTSGAGTRLCQNELGIPVLATWHGTKIERELDNIAAYVFVDKKRVMPIHVERLLLDNILPNLGKNFQGGDYRSFDRHVVISEFMKAALIAFGVPEQKIDVIYNSVPDGFFKVDSSLRSECQKKFGVGGGGRFVIGLVGRMVPLKGHGFFVEQAAKLDPAKYELLLVGAGKDLDQYNHSNLKVTSVRLTREEMPSAYCAMDLFLNPTFRTAGFDMTVQESLAAGVPCLVSNTSQYKSFFEQMRIQYGEKNPLFLFNVGDGESLIAAINRVLNRRQRIVSAQEYLKELFKSEYIAERYLMSFQKVIGAQSQGG